MIPCGMISVLLISFARVNVYLQFELQGQLMLQHNIAKGGLENKCTLSWSTPRNS